MNPTNDTTTSLFVLQKSELHKRDDEAALPEKSAAAAQPGRRGSSISPSAKPISSSPTYDQLLDDPDDISMQEVSFDRSSNSSNTADAHQYDFSLLGDSCGTLLSGSEVAPSTSGGFIQAHQCPVCGRYFARLWHLKRHMNIHLAVKPFNCPYCPHSANVKSNLQVHIRNIHGDLPLSSPPPS